MENRIIISGRRKRVLSLFQAQLHSILGRDLNILTAVHGDPILNQLHTGDVLLASVCDIDQIPSPLPSGVSVISLSIAFQSEGLNHLRKRLEPQEVIVVEDTIRHSSLLIMNLLQLGITQLQLIPADLSDSSRFWDKTVLISQTEAREVTGAREIIDIKLPVLDMTTILDVALELGRKELLTKKSVRRSFLHVTPIHKGLSWALETSNGHTGTKELLLEITDGAVIGIGCRAKYHFEDILGDSRSMTQCISIAKRMASSDSSLLITGESGTGKEMFAQAIHNASPRKSHQFVALNCAAIPENLLESELFGYEEGAFTGAKKGGKLGMFELAQKGTLFLDEISEMPLTLQKRFLRVLQEREVMRLGGDCVIPVDVRIVSATNRDLRTMVQEGSFREDLYYRLSVLPLAIPPLRSRPEDLELLIRFFRNRLNARFTLSESVLAAMKAHLWPGNVRELENYMEYFANLGVDEITTADLAAVLPAAALQPLPSRLSQSFVPTGGSFVPTGDSFVPTGGSPVPTGGSSVPAGGSSVPTGGSFVPTGGSFVPASEFSISTDEISVSDPRILFILQTLEEGFRTGRRRGRRSISHLAHQSGIFLSEQETRHLLLMLREKGLVDIHPTKAGTVITPKGLAFLRNLQ